MEESTARNSALAVVKKCQPTVEKAYELQRNILYGVNEINELTAKIQKGQSKKRIWIWVLLAILSVVLSLIAPVIIIVYLVWRNKTNEKKVEEYVKNKNTLEYVVSNEKRELMTLLQSEEGRFALEHLPKNYFYPYAVDRFIFYFENGHAETFKEALKEYDTYIHNCRMEYEAARAADANERAAKAAEKSAKEIERIRLTVETIEQETNSISFWTKYDVLMHL